ncbi:MAG: sodium-dependent bicarbonate transport family permease [Flavobacterium sp. BFFFF2]|nr:MAG: sodium-dependent bicarbonate transport family permease [Flavobacterium sp. BFFFF2]
MNLQLLTDNLTNPALLFFLLGVIAVQCKSDLEIPPSSAKFISLYLLLSIGFKGGQELAHSSFSAEILGSVALGIATAVCIPFYTFFILRRKFTVYDAGAVAAAYGSVSAVTFVTAGSFLEAQQLHYSGHMVAVMALMEVPAIIVGVILIRKFATEKNAIGSMSHVLKHSVTNGSVLLILGSLCIGFMANEQQAEGIRPFTNDLFKGFLAIFLLDMGLVSGKKMQDFIKNGWFAVAFSIFIPLVNGCVVACLSGYFVQDLGNRFVLSVLAASASYIAVPAAMKMAVPKANPGLFLPMALAITFPLNITIGMPLYLYLVRFF